MAEKQENRPRVWTHWLNYHRDRLEHRPRGRVVNVGFWIHGLPRLLVLCRIFGHKPVVDGTGTPGQQGRVYRWVVCDRCGDRPDPQGSLDPERWDVGARYGGLLAGQLVGTGYRLPGPWGAMPRGVVGGQIVVGASHGGLGWEVKIGNAGSEHTLALSVHLGWLGAFYLHTEGIGVWLQRRFNPTGYESRLVGFEIGWLQLRWKLWAKRNEWSRSDPWWQQGTFKINLLDRLYGPKRYSYEDIGEPAAAVLRMPHGDDYPVKLQLQLQTHGRRRQIRHRPVKWTVDCDIHGGVPTKRYSRGGGVWGCAVELPASVGRRDHPDPWHDDQWIPVALAALAVRLTRDRAGSGFPIVAEPADR